MAQSQKGGPCSSNTLDSTSSNEHASSSSNLPLPSSINSSSSPATASKGSKHATHENDGNTVQECHHSVTELQQSANGGHSHEHRSLTRTQTRTVPMTSSSTSTIPTTTTNTTSPPTVGTAIASSSSSSSSRPVAEVVVKTAELDPLSTPPPLSSSFSSTSASTGASTTLRHRKSTRSIHQIPQPSSVPYTSHEGLVGPTTNPSLALNAHQASTVSSDNHSQSIHSSEDGQQQEQQQPQQHQESTIIQRKPSLSTVRNNIPTCIKISPPSLKSIKENSGCARGATKSPSSSTPLSSSSLRKNHAPAKSKNADGTTDDTGSMGGHGSPGSGAGSVDDQDFDWEENKVEQEEVETDNSSMSRDIQDDVCCSAIQRNVHPLVIRFIINGLLVCLYSIPVIVQRLIPREHHHHHNVKATIVMINSGRSYLAVMLGLHLGYFFIQILVRFLFKLAYNCGSIKHKLKLETHDSLVPAVGRSVWLGVLTLTWYLCVHRPTCILARHGHETEIVESIVDLTCRRWVFWWVTRFLAGVQLTNILYLLKRYAMQSISDRFDQDSSRLREAHFQGYVLEALEKIKRANKMMHYYNHHHHHHHHDNHLHLKECWSGHPSHYGSHSYMNHHRWVEGSTKYLGWTSNTHSAYSSQAGGQGVGSSGGSGFGKGQLMSQPNSAMDEKPPTAGILSSDHQQHLAPSKRSMWEYLKHSFVKRREKRNLKRTNTTNGGGGVTGSGASPAGNNGGNNSGKGDIIDNGRGVNSNNSMDDNGGQTQNVTHPESKGAGTMTEGESKSNGGNKSKRDSVGTRAGAGTSATRQRKGPTWPSSKSILETEKEHEDDGQEFMGKRKKTRMIDGLRNKPIENPYKKARELWEHLCPNHRNYLERSDLEGGRFSKKKLERIWRLFDPNGGDTITRAMFKKGIVDIVNLRKKVTSAHKAFENAMAKLDMLFNLLWIFFAVISFLIVYDVGVQQYAVGVSSLVVGCAFVTGTSAKNAFESMIFIFVMGAFFTVLNIHILTTEMRRGDGMHVFCPNYVLATRQIHNLSRS
ncbi:hypothetical protein BGZ94_004181, partial [Podila epigama]